MFNPKVFVMKRKAALKCFILLSGILEISSAPDENVELLVAVGGDHLYRMNLEGSNKITVPDSSGNGSDSLAHSPHLNQIFFSNHKYRFVNRRFLNNSTRLNFLGDIHLPAMDPVSMDYDYVGKNLYVADNSAGKISVFNVAKNIETIIPLYDYKNSIQSISLDPGRGLMFMSAKFRDDCLIIRMTMDGHSRQLIQKSNTKGLTMLRVDEKMGRLFWSDSFTINSVNYEGNDMRVAYEYLRDPKVPTFDVYEGQLFWSDGSMVKRCDLTKDYTCNENSKRVLRAFDASKIVQYLRIIRRKMEERIYESTYCERNNGGCGHVCLASDTCACNLTWELTSDRKKCRKASDYLLYRMGKTFVIGGRSFEGWSDVIYPISAGTTTDLDYDFRGGYVFYVRNHRKICKQKINSDEGKYCFISAFYKDNTISSPAYDWVGRNIFYVEDNVIFISAINQKDRVKAIYSGGHKIIKQLTVDPRGGYIYFVRQSGFKAKTRSSSVCRIDKQGPSDVIKRGANESLIELLSIDFVDNRLFWIERSSDVSFSIGTSNFDGSDQRTFRTEADFCTSKITSFTVHGGDLFLACDRNGVWRVNKRNGRNVREFAKDAIYEIKTFSAQSQPLPADGKSSLDF